MKQPQFLFYQGSTPTLSFALPYPIGANDTVYATFSQQGQTVTEYALPADSEAVTPTGTMSVDAARSHVLNIAMTQADTFLFAAGDCDLQIRVKKSNGSADTLFPVHGAIGKAQKGTVI